MNILRRIYNLYLKQFYTERWARNMGVIVGRHTKIYPGVCFSAEPYLISIGEHVQVTSGVSFYTHGGGNSVRKKYPKFDCFGKIRVEDWAYLGAHSLIMPGVTIGEGAIVAAGSVVTKSVQPHTIVAGNPARYICDIETYIRKNMHFNVNTKGLPYNKKKEFLLSLSEDKFIKK